MSRVLAIAVLMLVGLASSVAASEGEGGFINIDKSLLIQAVNFALLLYLLGRFLYRPLLAKMDERTQAIKRSLDEAATARAEAQRERDENAARLQAALAEAQSIRAAALQEAADEQRRLVDAARAEADRLVAATKAELAQDVNRARQELRREVGDVAVQVAERLIRRSLRDDDHRRIVDEAIARIGKAN